MNFSCSRFGGFRISQLFSEIFPPLFYTGTLYLQIQIMIIKFELYTFIFPNESHNHQNCNLFFFEYSLFKAIVALNIDYSQTCSSKIDQKTKSSREKSTCPIPVGLCFFCLLNFSSIFFALLAGSEPFPYSLCFEFPSWAFCSFSNGRRKKVFIFVTCNRRLHYFFCTSEAMDVITCAEKERAQ